MRYGAIRHAVEMWTAICAPVALALAPGSAQGWTLKTLYNFCSQTHCTDGS